jgi:hypothetical protein
LEEGEEEERKLLKTIEEYEQKVESEIKHRQLVNEDYERAIEDL